MGTIIEQTIGIVCTGMEGRRNRTGETEGVVSVLVVYDTPLLFEPLGVSK